VNAVAVLVSVDRDVRIVSGSWVVYMAPVKSRTSVSARKAGKAFSVQRQFVRKVALPARVPAPGLVSVAAGPDGQVHCASNVNQSKVASTELALSRESVSARKAGQVLSATDPRADQVVTQSKDSARWPAIAPASQDTRVTTALSVFHILAAKTAFVRDHGLVNVVQAGKDCSVISQRQINLELEKDLATACPQASLCA